MDEEWIYCIDDDAYVPGDHFEKFIDLVRRNPGAAIFGGPNLLPERSGKMECATNTVLTSKLGAALSLVRYKAVGELPFECGEESLILCNLFLKRAVLGPSPFPAWFVCAEENFLLYRLKKVGLLSLYCPTLYNWHERRSTLARLFKQVFNYGAGRGQFAMIYPKGIRIPHLIPTLAVLYSTFSLGWFAFAGEKPIVWLALSFIYILACLASVLRQPPTPRDETPWWSAILFPIVQSSYGIGILYGLILRRND
jgi:GT2 family glycosyltransferase